MQLSLLELNQYIKKTLESYISEEIWVVAEIGEMKHGHQGHVYLDLIEKKENQIAAKIKANIWAYSYQLISGRFEKITGQSLKEGMKILAQVKVTFHEHFGLSLNIKDIDPNFTLGERARKRQEIIQQLANENLLNRNKTLNLPRLPQRIAVISSPTAAGYGDFLDQISSNKSNYSIRVELFPAIMQGQEGASSIKTSLIKIQSQIEKFDVIVLIRGGGAQTDLDCFDDYELAKEIAHSSLPVITGIGHERDETIADLVAHTKMKTPTAVAEFILQAFRELEDLLNEKLLQLNKSINQVILFEEKKVQKLETTVKSLVIHRLKAEEEILNHQQKQLKSTYQNRSKFKEMELSNFEKSLLINWKNSFENSLEKLNFLEKDLKNLNPKNFYKKGYSKSEVKGIPLSQLNSLKEGEQMMTFFNELKITSTIEKIENGKNNKL
jgi:exodeoxyribonuclease VII large subunit